MEDNDILFDKIEDYIRGRMPAEEKATFEQRIEADPNLAEQIQLHRLEEEGLELLVEENIKQKFERWRTNPPPGADNPGPQNKWGLVSGVLIVLAIAAWWMFRTTGLEETPSGPSLLNEPSTQEPPRQDEPAEKPGPIADRPAEGLPAKSPAQKQAAQRELIAMAEDNYQFPDHLGGTLKSVQPDAVVSNPLDAGIAAFSQNNWKSAIAEFRKIEPSGGVTQYAQAREWLGHAYVRNSQYTQAVEVFQWLLDQNINDTSNERAEWYLLLSLLPDLGNSRAKVNALLDKMTAPENLHSFQEDAQKIKTALEQSKL